MKKVGKIRALFRIFQVISINPRISKLKIHKNFSPYESKTATYDLIEYAYSSKIFIGPYIFCNSPLSMKLIKNTKNQLKLVEKADENPQITHAVALCGDYSYLHFFKGVSDLKYTLVTKPSFPAKRKIKDLIKDNLTKGKIPSDPYPTNWDDLDYKIYYVLREENNTYSEIGRKLGVSWEIVKRRYQKILRDSKILMGFFPKGEPNYESILFTFKTEFETGIYEVLKGLDRSNYIYKFKDTLLITFYADEFNATCKIFKEMEDIGIIQDLTVSIPIRYNKPSQP